MTGMTEAAQSMGGGCLCGRIRFEARVDKDDAYLCHCRMCQRATGNVSVAFVNLLKTAVTWKPSPDYYASSSFARRPFCSRCGTSLGFEYADSANCDLTVAAFDDPGRFRPVHHFGVESLHVAWLDTADLPRYRADEYQPLVDRWKDSVGQLPD